MKGIYDELRRMDGRRDVDLDGDRRTIGGLAGRRDKQGIHQVSLRVTVARLLTLFGHATSLGRFLARLTEPHGLFNQSCPVRNAPRQCVWARGLASARCHSLGRSHGLERGPLLMGFDWF
jgi:hypothetical protein